ncbi:DUF4393 domain-containing protein [Bacillus sp. 1NLA3E]|uniref:DUF4393 domain-containing protein n=1 Tax=Bacillus sp. 1NLA3E TaxID=666686 RepID=UPI000247E642|nr:DUF4393 domain-containing protein [Bacillus sp. 1NLA3E]AGK52043.1 hypothetical protein B1NLA3E_01295 [Bacillus sp. 1NLA3E]
MTNNNIIKDTADSVRGIVEAVPVYEDLLQPAAQELGKGLQTLSKTINIALSPISGLVWGYEQIKGYIQPALEKRFKSKPKENIVPPDVTIAGPTLEALRFTGHNVELRELFANLLATSMDKYTSSKAHPSFIEILKQITSDEAKLLRGIGVNYHPIISVRAMLKDDSYLELVRNFTILGEDVAIDHWELLPNYLENLRRLGLINTENVTLKEKDVYKRLNDHSIIKTAIQEAPNLGSPRIITGYLNPTPFGKQFYEACIKQQ